MMADDFGRQEDQEFFREFGRQIGGHSEGAQPGDLPRLSRRVRRRQIQARLQPPHLLSAFEALGEQMENRGIEIVYGAAQIHELRGRFVGLRQWTYYGVSGIQFGGP